MCFSFPTLEGVMNLTLHIYFRHS